MAKTFVQAEIRKMQAQAKKTGESIRIFDCFGNHIGHVLKDGSFYAYGIIGPRLVRLVAAVSTNLPRDKRNRQCIVAWQGVRKLYANERGI